MQWFILSLQLFPTFSGKADRKSLHTTGQHCLFGCCQTKNYTRNKIFPLFRFTATSKRKRFIRNWWDSHEFQSIYKFSGSSHARSNRFTKSGNLITFRFKSFVCRSLWKISTLINDRYLKACCFIKFDAKWWMSWHLFLVTVNHYGNFCF